MKRVILYCVLIMLAMVCVLATGCVSNEVQQVEHKLYDHKCTDSQLDRAEREFRMCMETNYSTSYCFYQSKKSQCSVPTPHRGAW